MDVVDDDSHHFQVTTGVYQQEMNPVGIRQ